MIIIILMIKKLKLLDVLNMNMMENFGILNLKLNTFFSMKDVNFSILNR